MRTKLIVVAALLLVSAGARAQDTKAGDPGQQDIPKKAAAPTPPDVGLSNSIDFGLRGTSFAANSDTARFQRYQDLRDGATLDAFRFTKMTDAYLVKAQADHVGYRDQRFFGSYNNYGSLKASFEWNQTPLFYSNRTATLFTTSAPGVLTLSDAVQTGLQNKTLTLPGVVTGASVFDLKARRDVADVKLGYSANKNVDINVTFKNTERNGAQPYGATFGISGIVASELPAPIDQRTTDFGANMEFSNDRGFARLGYDGSFFRNNIPTLTWDNPLRVTDSATAGPVQGRMALSPNTDVNSVSATGGLNLPGRSRATAYISVGQMSNNDPLMPFTINSALPAIPLDRLTADVQARVTAMNYSFTSRPTSMLWFNARYRQYEFDNRTKPFAVAQNVNFDTSVVTLNKETEPLGYTRHTFDADASFSPITYLGFRAGYTREQVDRTFRVVEKTTEDIVRTSIDATGITWLTVRGVYEHSKRRGSAINTLDYLAIGEQPSLRQFDIADRDKDRFSGIIVVTPVSQFSVNASAGIGKEDYPATDTRTVFGLRNNDNHVYSIGFDFTPVDKVSLGASYGYEKYTALQASRTANPLTANTQANLDDPAQQYNDARRDWTDNSSDKVRTIDASCDLLKVIPKTDIKVAYSYSKADSLYVYGLAANQTVFTTTSLAQLPAVTNDLQRGTIDGRYFLTQHFAVGLVYWYDKYDVNDFALGPLTSLAQPATASASLMLLGNYYRPYTANTFMGRLTYLW